MRVCEGGREVGLVLGTAPVGWSRGTLGRSRASGESAWSAWSPGGGREAGSEVEVSEKGANPLPEFVEPVREEMGGGERVL